MLLRVDCLTCGLTFELLAAIMEVKEDFLLYRSGVYRYSMPADYLPENDRLNRFQAVSVLG